MRGQAEGIAHYAAESTTGTNKDEEYKFAYPNLPLDVIGGRAMKSSALTLTIVNNQGTGDVEPRVPAVPDGVRLHPALGWVNIKPGGLDPVLKEIASSQCTWIRP